jgi:hypothetical protein
MSVSSSGQYMQPSIAFFDSTHFGQEKLCSGCRDANTSPSHQQLLVPGPRKTQSRLVINGKEDDAAALLEQLPLSAKTLQLWHRRSLVASPVCNRVRDQLNFLPPVAGGSQEREASPRRLHQSILLVTACQPAGSLEAYQESRHYI